MNTYDNKDNNPGTAISIINYKKLNPHWGNENKATEKKQKEVISSHTSTTHSYLLKAKQQPMCHACKTEYTVKHILSECTDLTQIRETFYNTNNMKELFQKIEMKNLMSFLKVVNLDKKNLKEFSIKPYFSYKKYFNKIWSIPQDVPKTPKKLFTIRRFPTNKLSTKPDSFY